MQQVSGQITWALIDTEVKRVRDASNLPFKRTQ